ncbi:tetratricopeptide repeat protein [Maledivibacter halophilus]|uniref:Tetratricopeptide repeat-containing protein n=1 Tax=Maledivibacter halophilus TaxID=36842 RepID=A0A1T5M3Z5_9FIRM|nr:tetratricopeptide repeat protein [Maledivibacter halophilus]SKC82981.1 Tetratricopeptide repeat-containing protein [Maledivibacter halophilus]
MNQEASNSNGTAYDRNVCQNCGVSVVEKEYDYPLCEECRHKLVKRPFPIGIKIFFILIVGIVIFSLIRFPHTLKGGIAYERGKRAEAERKYITAMEQYEIAYKNYPDSQDLIGKLIISKYRNGKIAELYDLFDKIYDIDIKNEDLYEELSKINDELLLYYPSEKLIEVLNKSKDNDLEAVKQMLTEYMTENPEDIAAKYYLADIFYELGQFNESKTMINYLRQIYPDSVSLDLYMAAIERDQGNYDNALTYCKYALNKNIENPLAYNAMSMIELNQSNYEKALEYVEKAYELDEEDINVLDTMVIVYHYNGIEEKRDWALEKIKQHPKHQDSQLQFLNELISGEIQ